MPSHVRMTIGLGAGLTLGLAAAWSQQPALLTLARGLRPLGTLFLNLLWMVVIPLVVTALFAGVAGLGSVRRVGRLGIRTLGFFWTATLAAIGIGFAGAALALPFAGVSAGGGCSAPGAGPPHSRWSRGCVWPGSSRSRGRRSRWRSRPRRRLPPSPRCSQPPKRSSRSRAP